MRNTLRLSALACALCAVLPTTAQALEWSDTSVGIRYGQQFAEPYNNQDISKHIYSLTHASGYQYGTQFANLDCLFSNSQEPAAAGSSAGARECYLVYRNTLDFERLTGQSWAKGPVRGVGFTVGLDVNNKHDVGYNSHKRMWVAGPSVMFDVPGYLKLSLLALWESNAPYNSATQTDTARYHYRVHPALDVAWGIALNERWQFKGYADFIAAKGNNEFGGSTAAETHVDMALLYDFSPSLQAKKGQWQAGVGYEWWRNKFGNDHTGPAGRGAWARTPMLRAEFHF